MPNPFEQTSGHEIPRSRQLTREEVVAMLESGASLEYQTLAGLDLSGLNFEGKSFRGSDLRGVKFYRQEVGEGGAKVEHKTNIKGANFTDAVLASQEEENETFFGRVDAEGASFGFSENLTARRKRLSEPGAKPTPENSGLIINVAGHEANFRNTTWMHADFGADMGLGPILDGADFTGATFQGCDMRDMDFSQCETQGIKILDPVTLAGMTIREDQMDAFTEGILFANPDDQAQFLEQNADKDPRAILEDFFEMVIV